MKVLSSATKIPLRLHLAFQLLCTDFPWWEGKLKCQLLEEIIITALPASVSDLREEEQKQPDATLFFSHLLLLFFSPFLPFQPLPIVSE